VTRAPKRRAAYVLGLDAEFWAEILLRAKLYSIRERRYLGGGGEVDLIVSRGRTLVFVEVKARATIEDARASITPAKLQRIAKAARHYLGRQGRLPETIRCDAILVAPNALPRHIVQAGELPLD
jgi:putative endonuclease